MTATHHQSDHRQLILQINSTLYIGGAEKVLACLAGGIDLESFRVLACYLKDNGLVGKRLARSGVEVIGLSTRNDGVDRLTGFRLRRLIRSRGIKLMHSHDIHSLVDGALCRLTVRGLRHVHSFHWGDYPRRQRRFRLIERVLWRVPDMLVAVGRRQADELQKLYGIPVSRIKVIWNGVDRAEPRTADEVKQYCATHDMPIVMSISTLTEQKGLEFLVEAACLLKRRGLAFMLLVVGDGPMRGTLERQAQELNLTDQIRFLGWFDDAASTALPAADVFVQSSRWEAMSVAVLEAMAAGKPTVVTATGDNNLVVLDGETGFIVPPADPDALATALAKLISDAPLRLRMGIAAGKRHAEQFAARHMVAAHELLYRQLLRA